MAAAQVLPAWRRSCRCKLVQPGRSFRGDPRLLEHVGPDRPAFDTCENKSVQFRSDELLQMRHELRYDMGRNRDRPPSRLSLRRTHNEGAVFKLVHGSLDIEGVPK